MLTGVFHGPGSEQAAQNIMREGFLIGGVDVSSMNGTPVREANGHAYGHGVYAVSVLTI